MFAFGTTADTLRTDCLLKIGAGQITYFAEGGIFRLKRKIFLGS
jgi:hypothetical protein